MKLDESNLDRYSRQIILNEIGINGQERLLNSKVFIIGAGALGCPAGLYLAGAGVGEIAIADMDFIEVSNLQRQIAHTSPKIGEPKAISLAYAMSELNPQIKITPHICEVNASNILNLIKGYDFVIDATDNFASKFLINDACVSLKIPFSHAGVLRWGGQSMSINPGQSACYACVFDTPPPDDVLPSCASAGVLGSVAGLISSIQASEAIKILSGVGEPLFNSLLSFDAFKMEFRKVKFKKNPHCRVCGADKIEIKEYEKRSCEL